VIAERVEEKEHRYVCNNEATNETNVGDSCSARMGERKTRKGSRRIRVVFRGVVWGDWEKCHRDHFDVCFTREGARSSSDV
jgi:hypothetical protein